MLTQSWTPNQVEEMLVLEGTNSLFRPPSKWNIHPSTCQQNWGTYEAWTPTNIKEVRHFPGLTGYYQIFICNVADTMHPLNCITHKAQPLIWTPECQAIFDMLFSRPANAPIVQIQDPNKPYLLFTGTSKFCYWGVLTQVSTEDSKEALLKILTGKVPLKSVESQTQDLQLES